MNNGISIGRCSEGSIVTITATPPTGKQFKAWQVENGGVTLANATAATTTFEMPAHAVEVTATYEDVPTYTVKVNGGHGVRNYAAGETVEILAMTPPADPSFKGWQVVSGGVTLVDQASTYPL